ncbi:MAG TPA: efflux RND transporter periplasmic adaptor subunit [Edaphobacter sp.]|nr:efflux RND transporter periplasmic adaptor subunit [Edaphobacter sp.]
MKTTAATLLSLVVLAGCRSSTPARQPQQQPVSAQIFTVASQNLDAGTQVSGVIRPRLDVDIAPQISGPIAVISKREGDRVRRGEVLVRIHAPALNAGVSQAQAGLTAAERQSAAADIQAKLASDTLTRYQQLRESHSVTPHELDQIRAQSAAAEAQQKTAAAQIAVAREALSVQRANAGDAVLIAPFDGVITQRLADPGAMAAPGVPILHLQSSGAADVHFTVPDTLIGSIHPGQHLDVSAGSDSSSATATVASLSPAGDVSSHSFLVKASLPGSASWQTGTIVTVTLPVAHAEPAIFIPQSALVSQGGLTAVLVLREDRHAEVRYVTVGRTSSGKVQVLTGLVPGDRILSKGDLSLAERLIEVRS